MRSSNLSQAASAVFALTAVVPLLIFVWTLHSLDMLARGQAQVGLCLALALALVGYAIFRRLVGQMSDVMVGLGKALETAPVVPAAPPDPPVSPATAPAPAPMDRPRAVPGLGVIQEVEDLSRTMAALWQREAAAFQGQRVVISVVNSPRPISGTLVKLGHDGLLIQTDRQDHIPVGYGRIAAIDAEKLSA